MELLILQTVVVWCFIGTANSDAIWHYFASSPNYANLKLVSDQNGFPPTLYAKVPKILHLKYLSEVSKFRKYDSLTTRVNLALNIRITKEELLDIPLFWAKMDCGRKCSSEDNCQAFNFYETNGSYICELQPQNLCTNLTSRVVTTLVGSYIWDKLVPGRSSSCIGSTGPVVCEVLRPGCLGTWPNCYSCIKHCIDCKARYTYTTPPYRNCTLWPDGDGPSSVPVFGTCQDQDTFIFRRKINLTTGMPVLDYRMSVFDMHRVTKLRAYPKIAFWFRSSGGTWYNSIYTKPFVDPDGNLMNISFSSSNPSNVDVFKLNGQPLKPTPFVVVIDDKYSCGSFWLLDPNNATYCPGGSVSLLGTLQVQPDTTKILNTGIRWPAYPAGTVIEYGTVSLVP